MKRIFKYPVILEQDKFPMQLPEGAKILTFQAQYEQLYIWALIDPDVRMERRFFRLYGTGHLIENSEVLTYIGTAQMAGGGLIWHLFEVR